MRGYQLVALLILVLAAPTLASTDFGADSPPGQPTKTVDRGTPGSSASMAPNSTPTPLLYVAGTPTIYVLFGYGGTSPGTGTSSKPGSSSGGGSGNAAAQTDNQDGLLLVLVASRLQAEICKIENTSQTLISVPGKTVGTSKPCQNPIPAYLVIPETNWTVEDFRNQCIADPYVRASGAVREHGTLGGVVMNGAITSQDGSFQLFRVLGATEANFASELINCDAPNPQPDETQASRTQTSMLWGEIISSGSDTKRLSLFPFAVAGAWIGANLTAKEQYINGPISNAQSATQQANTGLVIGAAIGSFASGLSSLTVGNPNSGLTLRKTFERLADELQTDLSSVCGSEPIKSRDVCIPFQAPTKK
jgi:hypothetical protein